MTASASTIGEPAVAELERQLDRTSERNGVAAHDAATPAHASGVELLGNVAGSGYRRVPALVRRADGQTIQLTPVLFHLLEAIDGRRSNDELAATLGERIGKLVSAEDVRYLVEAKLRPLGLLRPLDGTEPKLVKANPLLALRLKLIVTDPNLTRRLTAPFAAFFRPSIVVAVVAAFAMTTWWVVFEKGLASAAHHAIYEPSFLLLVFGLTVLSAGFHEVGHAAACRCGGGRPGAMGVGLYLVWPAFYTDVTDSYRMSRRDRLRVDLGGLYFNAIFGVAVVVVWSALRWDALLLVVAAQLIQMARQLVPVVRFDGYHVLADLIGVPDLFAHIKPTLLGLLPTRWGRAEGKALKPWARTVVTLWVLFVVPLLAGLLALLVVVLPRLVATAWDSLGLHWIELDGAWAAADVSAVAVALLSMLTICLPLVGIPYLLVRVLRQTVRGALRATAGRPALRVGAALAGAALVAAVAWSWWPDGQYRPIESSEKWAAAEAARVANAPDTTPETAVAPMPATTVSAPTPVAPTTAVAAPAAPEPTPQWAIVLVPHGTAEAGEVSLGSAVVPVDEMPVPFTDTIEPPAAPPEPAPAPAPETEDPASAAPATAQTPDDAAGAEWPFPFAPPAEPEEGDNQARAVNTEDGSTKVDVALALVWVTDGGPVDNRNEAYALASCRDCRTVAIAFQVVLVVGYAQVVTPINAAVAVNYACVTCATHALAVQLVATLTREPSEETMHALAAIFEALELESATFEQRPLTEVYGDLLDAREQTLGILATGTAVVEAAEPIALEESASTPEPTGTAETTTTADEVSGTPAEPTTSTTTTTTVEETTPAEDAGTSTTTTDDELNSTPFDEPDETPDNPPESGTGEDAPADSPESGSEDPPADEEEPPAEPTETQPPEEPPSPSDEESAPPGP